eukprot:NODE_317_length_11122_cov_0.359521.p1 type:complete len:441 gc:universal NODE_317_length_11122_cov_0.359521:8828-10150(+)
MFRFAIRKYGIAPEISMVGKIKVASIKIPTPSAALGIWYKTGSAFESSDNNGTAHFLEHLLFKGSKNTSQAQLEEFAEHNGVSFTAFTTREQTCYAANALKSKSEAAFRHLAEMTSAPLLDSNAIENEKHVILREMEEIGKDQMETIFDHLHAVAYNNQSLGYTILGTDDVVKSMNKSTLRDFHQQHYSQENAVVTVVGDIEHSTLCQWVSKYLNLPSCEPLTVPDASFLGSDARFRHDDMKIAHMAFAVQGPSHNHPDYIPMLVASSLLGQWDKSLGAASKLSSPLAQKFAKYDLANSYMGFYATYNKSGLFGYYIQSENKESLDQVISLAQVELLSYHLNLKDSDVARAKQATKHLLMKQQDGNALLMEDLGRQLTCFDGYTDPLTLQIKIDHVSRQDIVDVLAKYVYDKDIALVGIGPLELMPDYNRVRASMNWLKY